MDFSESILFNFCNILGSSGPTARGGGSAKIWSSMLEKNLVWNGGSKMEKLCGIVWTQNGGEICKSGCDMGIKLKMTQNVCGMGGFHTKKAHFR